MLCSYLHNAAESALFSLDVAYGDIKISDSNSLDCSIVGLLAVISVLSKEGIINGDDLSEKAIEFTKEIDKSIDSSVKFVEEMYRNEHPSNND